MLSCSYNNCKETLRDHTNCLIGIHDFGVSGFGNKKLLTFDEVELIEFNLYIDVALSRMTFKQTLRVLVPKRA